MKPALLVAALLGMTAANACAEDLKADAKETRQDKKDDSKDTLHTEDAAR